MVRVVDEGSVFEAPLERVWTLMRSQEYHHHPSMLGFRASPTSDPDVLELSWEMPLGGLRVPMAARLTFYPPLGFTMDYVEGPLAGSKEFEFYTPHGDRTAITVVGDYVSPSMDDEELRAAADRVLTDVFEEDAANLAAMPPTLEEAAGQVAKATAHH